MKIDTSDVKETSKYKRWHLPILLVLIILSTFIIRKHQAPEASFFTEEGVIFGTVYHAKYQYTETLSEEIMQTLQAVDQSLSMFNPQSTISRINRGETTEMDELLEKVLLLSLGVSKSTDGAFDVTIAPLVNAWGFGTKQDALPDSAAVDSILQFVGYEKLTTENHQFIKADPRMVADFSAVAKGFGVDQVAELFRKKGIENFMIEIGGEIVARGTNPKNDAWKIGINRPDDDSTSTSQALQTIIRINDNALATSGNYRNFYHHDGKKIAHTIDPKTGFPIQRSILSSTVMAPTCAMADAFATSFMVSGMEKAQAILGKHPELDAYFIYLDDQGNLQTWCTPRFKTYMQED